MRESRWPPPFTRALKRNLQGSFLLIGDGWWAMDDECWVLMKCWEEGEWDIILD